MVVDFEGTNCISRMQIRERSLTFWVVFWVSSDSEMGPKLIMQLLWLGYEKSLIGHELNLDSQCYVQR